MRARRSDRPRRACLTSAGASAMVRTR
jgi:hypothetical protein